MLGPDFRHARLLAKVSKALPDSPALSIPKPLTTSKKRRPRLGTGARFRALSSTLAARGAENPNALAAWIGRKKYGPKKFGALGRRARRRVKKHRPGGRDHPQWRHGIRHGGRQSILPDWAMTLPMERQVAMLRDTAIAANAGGDAETARMATDELRMLGSKGFIRKARQVRDADSDGYIYDNTPRQRPAPIQVTAPGVKGKRKATDGTGTTSGVSLDDHFANGGTIENAPTASGLLNYIAQHSERFDTRTNALGGISHSAWVIDNGEETGSEVTIQTNAGPVTTTKAVYLVKFDSNAVPDDILNEQMGAAVMDALGGPYPSTRWAASPDGKEPAIGQQAMIQRHIGQVVDAPLTEGWDWLRGGPNSKTLDRMLIDFGTVPPEERDVMLPKMLKGKGTNLVDALKRGNDPGSALRLALLDYVMMNMDRNPGNWMFTDDGNDGVSFVNMDLGFSFSAGDFFAEDWGLDPPSTFEDFTYAATDVEEALRGQPNFPGMANYAVLLTVIGRNALDGDPDKVQSEIDRALEALQSLDMAELERKINSVLPPLTQEQQAKVRQQLAKMKERIDGLNTADIMDVVMGA